MNSTTLPKRSVPLDFCRSVAILWVVLYHCQFIFPVPVLGRLASWGALGVDLFFVLSGYLIAEQWFRMPDKTILQFYVRRAFRIWPAYFVMLFLLVVFTPAFIALPSGVPLWKYVLFIQNFELMRGFGQSWSLCIEEHFYLVFPLLSLFLMQKRKSTWVIFSFAGVLLGGILLRSFFWIRFRPDLAGLVSESAARDLFYSYFYFPTWSRLDGLTLGVLMATIKCFRPLYWQSFMKLGNWLLLGSFLLFIFGVGLSSHSFALFLGGPFGSVSTPASHGYLPLTLCFLIWPLSFSFFVASALSPNSVLSKLESQVFSHLALLSYAIYLTHESALLFLDSNLLWIKNFHPLLRFLVSLCLMIGVASVLYWTVEKPFLLLRDWISTRNSEPVGSEVS